MLLVLSLHTNERRNEVTGADESLAYHILVEASTVLTARQWSQWLIKKRHAACSIQVCRVLVFPSSNVPFVKCWLAENMSEQNREYVQYFKSTTIYTDVLVKDLCGAEWTIPRHHVVHTNLNLQNEKRWPKLIVRLADDVMCNPAFMAREEN